MQVLDEELVEGHAGSLLHQHDAAGSSLLLRPRDALHGLQADPHQRRVEAEPRGLFQHLGPQLPLWDVMVSDLPGHWIPLPLCPLPLLHPQLLSRSVHPGNKTKCGSITNVDADVLRLDYSGSSHCVRLVDGVLLLTVHKSIVSVWEPGNGFG